MYATMYVVLCAVGGVGEVAQPTGSAAWSGARTLLPAGHDKLRPRDVTYELGSEVRRHTKKKLGG